jgi:predicted RNA-binding protein with PUA-like domain
VRNNLALKYLRNVRRGDQILFYQTGKDRAVAGIMRAASDPYPDPAADDERLVVVDVEVQQGLQRPVTLAELRQERAFEKSELLRIPRLSVMPISASQWQVVLRRAQGAAD